MLIGPTGTQGIAWIIHQDESSFLVYQGLHFFQVSLPSLIRIEIVEARLDASDIRDREQMREARSREQEVITGICKK